MAFHVRDPETDRLVRELAQLKGVGLTEAIHDAVAAELKREQEKTPLWERLQALAVAHGRAGGTEIAPDKKFFDDLSGH